MEDFHLPEFLTRYAGKKAEITSCGRNEDALIFGTAKISSFLSAEREIFAQYLFKWLVEKNLFIWAELYIYTCNLKIFLLTMTAADNNKELEVRDKPFLGVNHEFYLNKTLFYSNCKNSFEIWNRKRSIKRCIALSRSPHHTAAQQASNIWNKRSAASVKWDLLLNRETFSRYSRLHICIVSPPRLITQLDLNLCHKMSKENWLEITSKVSLPGAYKPGFNVHVSSFVCRCICHTQ